MKKSCSRFFLEWQLELEDDPEWWGIREVCTNLWWRNESLRGAFRDLLPVSTRLPVVDWQAGLNFVHPEQRRLVEDLHSACLKTGLPQTTILRIQPSPAHCLRVFNVFTAVRCAQCPRACALVLVRALPLVD